MWLIAARDLQYRRRRFLIAIAATGLVFGIALLLDGASKNISNETDHIVGLFHADRFVVARRATGPFTTTVVVPDDAFGAVTGDARADPFLVSRATVRAGELVDVNLVGYRPGGLGTPPIDTGRAVRQRGEVVVDSSLDVGIGDKLRVGPLDLRVVGTSSDIRFNFGTPSLFVALRDAQQIVFGGEHFAMAYAVRNANVVLDGSTMRSVTNQQAIDDLHRTTKSGSDTVSFINILLWIVAAGIVASMVYLNALERTRDFAVLKATGSSNRSIVAGLAFQAVLLTLLAAVLADRGRLRPEAGVPVPGGAVGGIDPEARRGRDRRRAAREPRRGAARGVDGSGHRHRGVVTVLAVRDLTIEYTSGGYKVRPIDELSLDVESGELVLLLGASGCGKTTLLSALATLAHADLGHDPRRRRRRDGTARPGARRSTGATRSASCSRRST